MATVIKSIGATARDYSTVTLWEAALSGAAGGGGNEAIGECYDDAAFDEDVDISDGTPDSITLRAATGEEHDGTAGTGVRIVRSVASLRILHLSVGNVSVETMEIDANHQSTANTTRIVQISTVSSVSSGVSRCILHGAVLSNGALYGIQAFGSETHALNCLVYDINNTSAGVAVCYGYSGDTGTVRYQTVYNLTVHNVRKNGSGPALAFYFEDVHASNILRNCIGTDTANAGIGSAGDFVAGPFSTSVLEYNLSSDATASGTGSLINKPSADLYVSNVFGSEDLHLKTGADAIDVGFDPGTTPTGVEIDLDGRDRDAEGDTWDMGAHEFVVVAGGQPTMRRWGGVPHMSPGPVLAGRSW